MLWRELDMESFNPYQIKRYKLILFNTPSSGWGQSHLAMLEKCF